MKRSEIDAELARLCEELRTAMITPAPIGHRARQALVRIRQIARLTDERTRQRIADLERTLGIVSKPGTTHAARIARLERTVMPHREMN